MLMFRKPSPRKEAGVKNRSAARLSLALFLLSAVLFAGTFPAQGQKKAGPNIIYILADDLGYGDLGCYGQEKFETPHIDRLAREGMRFTSHYAGAPVCAPSRSALMTGLHTGHTYIRGNKEVQPEGQWPLPKEARTLTAMAKSAGYITGVFGKWGLGYPGSEGAPHNHHVDEFFGYNCQRLAHHYYPEYLWDNQQKLMLENNRGAGKGDYAPELIHERALAFLDAHRDTTFFLFYPMVIPHAELVAPAPYMARYRGKFPPEKKYEGVDAGEDNYRLGPYGSQPESHAAFAAMISVMDEQVGSILEKVAALGLDENTIIMFSSDNGPHVEGGADPDYFDSNGVFRGYKRDVYEGGIRVPFIVRWPGQIEPGSVSEHVSAFWDIMPTVAEIVDRDIQHTIDGISFLPALKGEINKQKQHDHLYWEFHELGGRRALRQGEWKLVQYNVGAAPEGPYELYNLSVDPAEQNNVARKYPRKAEELKKIMLGERTPSEIFRFAGDDRD